MMIKKKLWQVSHLRSFWTSSPSPSSSYLAWLFSNRCTFSRQLICKATVIYRSWRNLTALRKHVKKRIPGCSSGAAGAAGWLRPTAVAAAARAAARLQWSTGASMSQCSSQQRLQLLQLTLLLLRQRTRPLAAPLPAMHSLTPSVYMCVLLTTTLPSQYQSLPPPSRLPLALVALSCQPALRGANVAQGRAREGSGGGEWEGEETDTEGYLPSPYFHYHYTCDDPCARDRRARLECERARAKR